jgi:hypothetical protein
MPENPIAFLGEAVEAWDAHLRPDGGLADPFVGEPTQYSTAYHAHSHAVLAVFGPEADREAHCERAARGLDAALAHVEDPTQAPMVSGLERCTGEVRGRNNHRDFFWPPILKGHWLLARAGEDAAQNERRAERIAAVEILESFGKRPPGNWASVWLLGEWLRARLGHSPYGPNQFDAWVAPFFERRIREELGFYEEPGHPNSYDLFTRLHLTEMLYHGYDGAWREPLERLLATGLTRSFGVQLSDGALASAHRSTGQTWNLGAQCAFFSTAAAHLAEADAERAEQARAAARRAYAGMARGRRAEGLFSPVENRLSPAHRVGYEGYTADAHYAALALSFLGTAIAHGFEGGPVAERAPSVHIEHNPTWRAVAHRGACSAHLNAWPAPKYDGFGLVDVSFGPGRALQLVSAAHRPGFDGWFVPGLARRGAGGLDPLASAPLRPTGPFEQRGPSAVALEARFQGQPWLHRLTVEVEAGAVKVEEALEGFEGGLTLVIPYPREMGDARRTEVRLDHGQQGASALLTYGDEQLRVTVDTPVTAVRDLPHGFENRRGLCGLLRFDLPIEAEGVSHRIEAA